MDYKAMPHIRLIRFIGGRVVLTAVTAFFVAAIVFFVVRSVPGDPALNVLGLQSTLAERTALRKVMALTSQSFLSSSYGLVAPRLATLATRTARVVPFPL